MLAIVLVLLSVVQAPQKQTLPGASNVTRVDASVMCGGHTTPGAFPEIRKLGFKSIVNLRRASEPGVDIPGARAAAAKHGLAYVHIPVDPSKPSTESVDAFLEAVTTASNQPVYIHCGSANRVAALWMIKRVVVDKWDVDRATEEAVAIGLTSPALKKFALEYLDARGH